MDISNITKQNLIQLIKPLIYDFNLGHLGVYSKQYFTSIIYSMFKDVSDRDFCFTYGDFNGLGKLNAKYGEDKGDFAVAKSIQQISATMPEDTIIVRIAGDEFAFLNDNFNKRQLKPIMTQLHEELNQLKNFIYGLSITTSSIDSNAYTDFDDLFLHSELDVEKQKKASKQKQYLDVDNTLFQKSIDAFSRFFNYYRFDESSLPQGFFFTLKDNLMTVISSRINKTTNELQGYNSTLSNSLVVKHPPSIYQKIDANTAKHLHTVLTSEQITEEMLDKVNMSDLRNLFNYLIRHPLTQQYSQKFFEHTLLPNLTSKSPCKDLTITYFDIMHMKLSNDIIGHTNTDTKMHELLNHIINPIKAKNHANSFFVMKGSSLILIEDAVDATPVLELDSYVQSARENQVLLDLVYAQAHCSSKSLSATVENLSQTCSAKKIAVKTEKIKDPQTVALSLQTALQDIFEYYSEHDPEPTSIASQQKFLNTLLLGLVEVISEKYPQQSISSVDERYASSHNKSLDD